MPDDFDPFEREFLHRACRIASGIDLVVCGKYRTHHFESEGRADVFLHDDRTGDSIEAIFAPGGMVITGVAHESSMSPSNLDSPYCRSKISLQRERLLPRVGIFDEVPATLMRRVKKRPGDRWRSVTFCYWYEDVDDEWYSGDVEKDEDEDEGGWLMGSLPRDAERLVDYFEDALGESWPKSRIDAVEAVFEFGKITDAHIEAWKPGAKKSRSSYAKLTKQLAELGLR